MAVDSLGRAEREQTMCLLEAVDRVLLSIDEVLYMPAAMGKLLTLCNCCCCLCCCW